MSFSSATIEVHRWIIASLKAFGTGAARLHFLKFELKDEIVTNDLTKKDAFTHEDLESLRLILKNRLNQTPRFTIDANGKVLELKFTLKRSIPGKLKSKNERLYRILFASNKEPSWIDIIKQVYNRSPVKEHKAGKVLLRRAIRELLHDAFCMLLAHRQNAGGDTAAAFRNNIELLKPELKKGVRSSRPRRGDKIRFAKCHEEILPLAKLLKRFRDNHQHLDDEALWNAIGKDPAFLNCKWLPFVINGCAFKHLPGDNANSNLKGKWAPWQLSVGIVYCKEEPHVARMRLEPNAIYRYIREGKKLLPKST